MVENEELVVINLYNSLLRVKVMVGILYEPKALTPEKVRALAGIVKMNLDITTIDNSTRNMKVRFLVGAPVRDCRLQPNSLGHGKVGEPLVFRQASFRRRTRKAKSFDEWHAIAIKVM